MKILLHICCAPCLVYPFETLNKRGFEITGYFANNNIHPFAEFKKRLDALKDYSRAVALNVFYDESYNTDEFLQRIAFNEDDRCRFCYIMRLDRTAREAAEKGFDSFSTTLLYSKYQKHEIIKKIGIDLSIKYGIDFYYEDFRAGWGRGIKLSKKAGIYRQKYCGCIYSEKEMRLRASYKSEKQAPGFLV